MGRRSQRVAWAGEAKVNTVMPALTLQGNKNSKILELIPGNKTNLLAAKDSTRFCAQSLGSRQNQELYIQDHWVQIAGEGLTVTPPLRCPRLEEDVLCKPLGPAGQGWKDTVSLTWSLPIQAAASVRAALMRTNHR